MDDEATFCVQCGSTEAPFIGAVCLKCFGARTSLASLPPYLDVTLCSTCGSREVRNHWEKAKGPNPEQLRPLDVDPHLRLHEAAELVRLRWTDTGQNPRLRLVEGTARVRVGGQEIEVPVRTEVHLILHSCLDCSRRGGHYFTSRVQLREAEEGTPREPREFKPWSLKVFSDHLRSCSESQQEAVSREEELKEGWDIFFADTAAARAVVRSLKARTGASVRETASLWGMRAGREIHRVTFLVRLPPVAAGDFLEDGGKLWEVATVGSRGELELHDVQRGTKRTATRAEVGRMRFVAGREGRTARAVVVPPRGTPFVRGSQPDEPLLLQGDLPPRLTDGPAETPSGLGPEPAGAGPEGVLLPLVVGPHEAWWAPRAGRRARAAPRESKR